MTDENLDSLITKCTFLEDQYQQSWDLSYLEEVIALRRDIVALIPSGSHDLADRQQDLATVLHTRYLRLGSLADLEEAVSLQRDLIAKESSDTSRWQHREDGLGRIVFTRYERFGSLADLEEAINLQRSSLAATMPGSSEYLSRQSALARSVFNRYWHLGYLHDLSEAIGLERLVATNTPRHAVEWPYRQLMLGVSLMSRYHRQGNEVDLEETILLKQSALQATEPHSPDFPYFQYSLAVTFQNRFTKYNIVADLEKAIALKRNSLSASVMNYSQLETSQYSLGVSLQERYDHYGHYEDLVEAIGLQRASLRSTPTDSPSQNERLYHLSASLLRNYEHTGDIDDLEEAIQLMRLAITKTSSTSALMSNYEHRLGALLRSRYERRAYDDDLDESVALLQSALRVTDPSSSGKQAKRQHDLAATLIARYQQMCRWDDLVEAVGLLQSALANPGHSVTDRPGMQRDLALALRIRYIEKRNIEDLNDAIYSLRATTAVTMREAPVRSQQLHDLADVLWLRYRHRADIGDVSEALACLDVALQDWERRLVHIGSARLQRGLFSDWFTAYQSAIRCALAVAATSEPSMDDTFIGALVTEQANTQAWNFAQRSRARQTLALTQSAFAGNDATVPLTTRQQAVMRALRTLERERLKQFQILDKLAIPSATFQPRSITATRRISQHQQVQVAERDNEIESLWLEISEWWPHLGALRILEPPDLAAVQARIRQLRSVLGPVTVLEFSQLDEELVLFVLTGDELLVRRIDVTERELRDHTARMVRFLDTGDAGVFDRDRSSFEAVVNDELAWLAERVWPAIHECLPEAMPGDDPRRVPHLLLSPSSLLQRWPLAALPIPGTKDCLLDHYAVQVIPSSDTLRWLGTASHASDALPFHGFAPPAEPSLPGCLAQVIYAATRLGHDPATCVLTGSEATFDALIQASRGIVLLATHAVMLLDRPDQSFIQFASADGGIEHITGLSLLAESGNRRRFAFIDLVACETHGAPSEGGENWTGLTRALLAAADQLTGSLWSLDDLVALAVGVVFWDGIAAGLTVAQAQRTAQRWVRSAHRSQLRELGERVLESMPKGEEREMLRQAWMRRHAGPDRWPPYAGLSWWAPFVTIGAPAALVTTNRGDDMTDA